MNPGDKCRIENTPGDKRKFKGQGIIMCDATAYYPGEAYLVQVQIGSFESETYSTTGYKRLLHALQRIVEDLIGNTLMQLSEFLVVSHDSVHPIDDKPAVPVDEARFPHVCPSCNGPAYIGFSNIDCLISCTGVQNG